MPTPFVHLSVHTEYSLVDSVIRHKPLIQGVAAAEMPAVAVADAGNLYGLVRFYRAAIGAGIKPLVAVDAKIRDGEDVYRLQLFAMNNDGYRRLTELVSRSFVEGQELSVPHIQFDWLADNTDGLLALSGGTQGDVAKTILAGRAQDAEAKLQRWSELFPNRFYIQIHRTGWPAEDSYIQEVVPLAHRLGLPLVATNEVRFIHADEYEDHETRVCIQAGEILADPNRPVRYSPQQYLRSGDEMAELFSDLPEAVSNTVELAKRCNVTLRLGESFLPDFPVPEGHSIASWLEHASEEGLKERMVQHWLGEADAGNNPSDEERAAVEQEYAERLKIELGVINGMGFPGYFLIVADFIQWSKNHDIPVGPGRGSGAGSLVAYALKITDLDPLKYDLLFERFLNPERVSMPDFDVDFCMEGRDRVIEYVAQTYGRDKVSQIITFGSMAAKASIRDVGRVLGQPYGLVDRVAKMVPPDVGMTLTKALDENPELKQLVDEEDEEVAPLFKKALALEGLSRNVGKHAGGVVISPSALTDFTPIYCEEGSDQFVSQFDKDDVEAAGLVKFDFLGLRTLTIIDWALKTINKNRAITGEEPLDMARVPLTDKAAYDLLCTGKTTAVFQLESGGMQRLLTQLKPDNFEDIVALVALFRPGPLGSGMVDDFVARKHGAEIKYPHPSLENILKPTYGVILYQEQVMQIAQVLSGYSLGGADILRRAMGKKKVEVMQEQLAIFVTGAKENGVEEKTAKYIFDLIEKFAGYGFNKSHSAAYALLTYQTAWLKHYYPAEFMAAVMTADMDNTDKVVHLIHDAGAYGLKVLPPDINRSNYQFTAVGGDELLYGLGAIKGVGFGAIEGVLKERDENGAYKDIYDLCRRNDLSKTNRKTLTTLVESGAFDEIGANRATTMEQLPKAVQAAEQAAAAAKAGQTDLFGLMEEPEQPEIGGGFDVEVLPEWEERHRLALEKAALGLYLTGHPIAAYEDELPHLVSGRLSELIAQTQADIDAFEAQQAGMNDDDQNKRRRPRPTQVVAAGWVIGVSLKQGKRAHMVIDDHSGRAEVSMFWEDYMQYQEYFKGEQVIIVEGGMGYDDYANAYSIRAKRIYNIDEARGDQVRRLQLLWTSTAVDSDSLARDRQRPIELEQALTPHKGGTCPVVVEYRSIAARGLLKLSDEWRITLNEDMLQELRRSWGDQAVKLVYRR